MVTAEPLAGRGRVKYRRCVTHLLLRLTFHFGVQCSTLFVFLLFRQTVAPGVPVSCDGYRPSTVVRFCPIVLGKLFAF